jgi:hypothetical protein
MHFQVKKTTTSLSNIPFNSQRHPCTKAFSIDIKNTTGEQKNRKTD